MRLLLILFVSLLFSACETVSVKDTASIETDVTLENDIALPVSLPVAYYADAKELYGVTNVSAGYYRLNRPTGKNFREALQLVMPSFFSNAEKLKANSDFEYLLVSSNNCN